MVDNFTQKEMMLRMMDKLESIEDKLSATHTQTVSTNGKVRLHTKWMYCLSGAFIALAGWIISISIGS